MIATPRQFRSFNRPIRQAAGLTTDTLWLEVRE